MVAALVRGKRHGTEARECALPRLCDTQAVGHEFSRFTLDVECEFVVELPLGFGGREEGARAEPEIRKLHQLGKLHDAVDCR